jgi:hypothetical protein
MLNLIHQVKPHNFASTPTSRMFLIDFGSAAPLLPPSPSGVQLILQNYCLLPGGTCDYVSPEILACHEAALVAIELEVSVSQLSQIAPNDSDSYMLVFVRRRNWADAYMSHHSILLLCDRLNLPEARVVSIRSKYS